MDFDFVTAPQRTSWEWLLEVWRRADDLEVFRTGWTFDHLYPLFGDSTEDCLEGWISLTALLHETRRLRGGVLVTGMVYRHPGVLANMVSTLDITSGGRLELGIGAGWNTEECDAFGIELGSMRERFDRFEEGLAVLESLFVNDRTTFDGMHYSLTEAMNNPKPVQRPMPICIGGKGRNRTLPLAGRYAHHWNYSGQDLDEFRELRDVLHASCEAAGRTADEVKCSMIARYEAEGDDAFRARLDEMRAAGVDTAIVGVPRIESADVIERIAASITG